MQNMMEMRWPVVLVSLIVSLGLLFGGYKLVQQQTVVAPLDVALHAIAGVQSYTWTDASDGRHLTLMLSPDASLGQTYTAVVKTVRALAPNDTVVVDVKDDRSPALQALYDQVNLAVQEGMQTGHYLDMADHVTALATKANAKATVTVDGGHVYVSLEQGGHRLLSVVQRPQPDGLSQGVSSNAW